MAGRMEKVDELIAQQLGQIIVSEVELPKGSIVTITNVKTSPDLKHAKVSLSILPDDNKREVMSLLINNAYEFQKILNEKVTLRSVPKLRFQIDDSGQKAAELEALLDNLQ
ncbi:30S ribosome-binding factor RbfA [Candidatus Falkowbacteria bacterium]|uniref:Ribosome-binding factor A n=1 Tax=Candidatus Buchananbacteria bacterium CG10_big_fil_rev_8_21_14_0_10_33_19 TaxID=1974525 RepID=A0A2H0W539_9BACT|nr:30S ribosome-binding factor RbfA [Candidatus Falkowbacteria bacterium]PIS06482.1 MAG: ribosome-binding factor A [Candidatus Buchananbacteria bacterium CG10_big_fil_rev_8_21_14_0_10_33_19]